MFYFRGAGTSRFVLSIRTGFALQQTGHFIITQIRLFHQHISTSTNQVCWLGMLNLLVFYGWDVTCGGLTENREFGAKILSRLINYLNLV